jgi:hypothetical protein
MSTSGWDWRTPYRRTWKSDWLIWLAPSRTSSDDLPNTGDQTVSKPRTAAAELIADYFAWRGESTPESDAEELLNRVQIIDRSRWFPRKHADDAIAIMQKSAFDIEHLAADFLGVDLKTEDLSRFDPLTGAPVFGLANPDEWSIRVCHRAHSYMPLLRATVAHEIGHLQLHSCVAAFSPSSSRRPRVELEADAFMHDTLAPPVVLHMSVALVAHFYGLRIDQILGGANLAVGRYLWKQFVLPLLVNNLCVSRQMLCLKFLRMGVMSQETYEWHLRYAMPNV